MIEIFQNRQREIYRYMFIFFIFAHMYVCMIFQIAEKFQSQFSATFISVMNVKNFFFFQYCLFSGLR